MSPEGFCHRCRADLPAEPNQPRPTCSACGYPMIPASFGRRTQKWINGAWVPAIPKPPGYVWRDPQLREQELRAADPNETRYCGHCGRGYPAPPKSQRRYCSTVCRGRAHAVNRAPRRKGAA